MSHPKSAIANRQSPIGRAHWARIRLFAMDVDGVLTDGTVQISSDGSEAKSFSILDGHGLCKLARVGVITAWISGRASGATSVRATELKIPHVIQGRVEKLAVLQELAGKLALAPEQCACMGDDDLDAPAMAWAGIGIAPPGALPAALAAAGYVTRRPAGQGAVREVCELMLAAQGAVGGALAVSAGSRPRASRGAAPRFPVRTSGATSAPPTKAVKNAGSKVKGKGSKRS